MTPIASEPGAGRAGAAAEIVVSAICRCVAAGIGLVQYGDGQDALTSGQVVERWEALKARADELAKVDGAVAALERAPVAVRDRVEPDRAPSPAANPR